MDKPRSIGLRLPFPPSANTYYRKVGVRMLISKAGRAYKAEVRACLLEQIGLMKPIEGHVSIHVRLHPGDKRRRDLDNFAGKALYDALTYAGAWLDDSQVKESHNYFHGKSDDPCCLIVIEELENGTDRV